MGHWAQTCEAHITKVLRLSKEQQQTIQPKTNEEKAYERNECDKRR